MCVMTMDKITKSKRSLDGTQSILHLMVTAISGHELIWNVMQD